MAKPRPDKAPVPIPRAVRPRKRTDRAAGLNIMTVTRGDVRSEHVTGGTDATYKLTDLPDLVEGAPESLIACTNHLQVFRILDEAFGDNPAWDWQLTVQQKRLRTDPRFSVEEVSLSVAGWKGENHKRGRWHHFLDPVNFAPNTPWPGDLDLYAFAVDVRAFLAQFQLHPTARAGGIAAQLLRHPDIYDQPRRQVPRFTNDVGRRAMPGNHYQFLDGVPGTEYPDVWYMDQEGAHHNIAKQVHLPHSDHLVAVGRSFTPDGDHPNEQTDPPDRVWVTGSAVDDFLKKWQPKGLLYGRLRLREKTLTRGLCDPAPRWYDRLLEHDTTLAYVFTNELDMLTTYGVEWDYLIAGWVSTKRDESLPLYAQWALYETRRADGIRRVWLKPTLHAAYGMLAAKTTRVEFVRKQGRGKERRVMVGETEITGTSSGARTFVPKITNTIQRGMIEAETRKRSCLLAMSLQGRGYDVLSIYADGVLVAANESEGCVPPRPLRAGGDTWRAKDRLSHLTFTDETHFRSAQLIRWPGNQTHHRTPTGRESQVLQNGNRSHHTPRAGAVLAEVQRAGQRGRTGPPQ